MVVERAMSLEVEFYGHALTPIPARFLVIQGFRNQEVSLKALAAYSCLAHRLFSAAMGGIVPLVRHYPFIFFLTRQGLDVDPAFARRRRWILNS